MNNVNKIMDRLDNISYGFIDSNGVNIFEGSNVGKFFNNVYHLMSPDELESKKYGVCWDQVELERKLFSDLNFSFKTYFIYINDFKYLPSHTFLVYEEDNKYYWFEHSWYDERGIHEFNSLNDLLNTVACKHVNAQNIKKIDQYDIFIFEYSKPEYNISCDEFYDFIFKQKRIYNYSLESVNDNDINRLKKYKLNSIVDYAENLTDDEKMNINKYINDVVPKQMNNYKNIIYNREIIGSVLAICFENEILLDEIFIESKFRNKGIGTSIIKDIINNSLLDIVLWVYKNNINAYKLYLKLGFIVVDETMNRYKMEYKI